MAFRNQKVRKEYFNKRRQDCMDFLREYKKNKSCVKCGWKEHTEILQFHHRDPKLKELKFARGSIANCSKKRILEEIKKCDLLCPNCHMWYHYQEIAK